MKPPSERQALRQIVQMLAELLDAPSEEKKKHPRPRTHEIDAVVNVGPFTFAVEWKGTGSAAPVSLAAEHVKRLALRLGGSAIPLVSVPYMGEVGRRQCQAAGVAWLDLSGNARICAPGLKVLVEGRPNRFKRPGRPSSAFGPRSSRITRWLLMHADRPMTQREIARSTGMDEGFTSRIVAKLEGDGLLVREPNGAVRLRDPGLMLDAWREEYEFSRHRILAGHIPARSGDELLRRLADRFRERGLEHAVTGLGAAWLFTHFAGFRLVTLYLHEHPAPGFLRELPFREDSRGANVWLVTPNDEGVLHGSFEHGGVRCVHPVQVYLDLKGHPERADEAAERLRAELLKWRADD